MANAEGLAALPEVLGRYESFNRLGALAGEGGERAFRGWLMGGFLQPHLGWPWDRIVLGESLDVLTLNWRDFPVIYIETKTPDENLKTAHRREIERRLHRWGSLRHVFLTNGHRWERFDHVAVPLAEPDATYSLERGERGFADFFAPLQARRYVR